MHKKIFFDLDHTLFDTPVFKASGLTQYQNYLEVEQVLKQLSKIAEVNLFSEGEYEFQLEKLKQTGIMPHFANIHIFTHKLEHLEKLFSETNTSYFLIDDKMSVLAAVKNYNSKVFTIWIKRGIYKDEIIPGFAPDMEIKDLQELEEMIKNKL